MLSGKKCTYGVKCKFYHPERLNQSLLSVADELRDRAKSLSPKSSLQDTHCPPAAYTSRTPPPPSTEDQSYREAARKQFIYPRESSSPRIPADSNLVHYPSLNMDEAFSSLDSCMSRLYIRDRPYSMERLPDSYSSGVASYSLSHDDYSHPGSYNGTNQRRSPAGGSYYHPEGCSVSCQRSVCIHCRCGHQQTQVSSHHPAWSSCPALPPHNREPPSHYQEKHYFRQPTHRQSHSLPREPWGPGSLSDSRLSEMRYDLRSQLSTLFPKDTVERVMKAYPHVSDMSELVSLIQSYRSNQMSF